MNDAAIAPLWEIGPFDLPQADMLSLNGRADRRTLSRGFGHCACKPE